MAQGGTTPDRRRALLVFLVTAFVVVVVDQVTKHLSVITLEDDEPVRLLWGAVYLTLVRNSGAAFSMFTDYTWVFPTITLGVVVALGVVMRRVTARSWGLALGLILGGALGNLGDRLFRSPGVFMGHVVDMISVFDPAGQVFPVFNGADSALCVGAVLVVLLELTGRRRDGTAAADSADTADVRG